MLSITRNPATKNPDYRYQLKLCATEQLQALKRDCINPKLVCLSAPGVHGFVERYPLRCCRQPEPVGPLKNCLHRHASFSFEVQERPKGERPKVSRTKFRAAFRFRHEEVRRKVVCLASASS